MQIEEITQNQLDLMIQIVLNTPLFSVATIPTDHKHYELKHKHYEDVRNDILHLERLGLVQDMANVEGEHHQLNAKAERMTGYKYNVYAITELGLHMFEAYLEEHEKEEKYRNSIN